MRIEEIKKYYDITYKGIRYDGGESIWRDVIDVDPKDYINECTKQEKEGNRRYYKSFELVSKREISKQGFNDFDGWF